MKTFIAIICNLIFCLNANCQTINKIVAKQAFSIINNRDTIKTVLIDGRSAEMFAKKHIKGALNIDAFEDSFALELKKYLDKEEIIVYCTNHRRAEILIEKLKEMQFHGKIIFISDGINGWGSAGLPIQST